MTAPHVTAGLDQAGAEARTLGEAIARMWTTYAEAGLPDDLARGLVAEYHRVACGAPVDLPYPPPPINYYFAAEAEEAEDE